MDDLTFLRDSPQGNASLVVLAGGRKYRMDNLHLPTIEKASPILALCFESRGDIEFYTFESNSDSAAATISLLRYAYLGDYKQCEAMVWTDTCSLRLHLEIFELSCTFGMPELKAEARKNFREELEVALDRIDHPVDFCKAITFLYSRLTSFMDLRSMIAHYCAFGLQIANLDQDPTFFQVLSENPVFHRDLLTVNSMLDYNEAGSSALIRLPVRFHPAEEYHESRSTILARLPRHVLSKPEPRDPSEHVAFVLNNEINPDGERRPLAGQDLLLGRVETPTNPQPMQHVSTTSQALQHSVNELFRAQNPWQGSSNSANEFQNGNTATRSNQSLTSWMIEAAQENLRMARAAQENLRASGRFPRDPIVDYPGPETNAAAVVAQDEAAQYQTLPFRSRRMFARLSTSEDINDTETGGTTSSLSNDENLAEDDLIDL